MAHPRSPWMLRRTNLSGSDLQNGCLTNPEIRRSTFFEKEFVDGFGSAFTYFWIWWKAWKGTSFSSG